MKKSFILLASLFAIGCLAGCGEEEKKDSTEYTIVADFEHYAPDFESMMLINEFGKVYENSNKKYVHGGDKSALLKVAGSVLYPSTKPLVYFPLSSNRFEFNKSNIKKYDSVNFFIYNDSDKDINIEVGFVGEVISYSSVDTSKIGQVVAKANSWNEFNLTIDHSHLNLFFNLEETPGLYFGFENNQLVSADLAPDIYLDDVRFVNSKAPHEITEEFILKENEICDFERDFQQYFVSVENSVSDQLNIKVVDDVDGVKASSGNKFLCIDVSKEDGFGHWTNWSSAFLTEYYMRKTNMMNIITEEDAKTYRFCFDVLFHKVSEADYAETRVVTRFWSRNQVSNRICVPCVDENTDDICAGIDKWTTMGFQFCKDYVLDFGSYNIDLNYTGINTGRFEFSVGSLSYDYQIFIDNVRLEKIA